MEVQVTTGPDLRLYHLFVLQHLLPHITQQEALDAASHETMASLNLSINGPSIKSSYQGVINGPGLSSTSATAARWALFTVQAPLVNAFQSAAAKESILKVESTGGECEDAAPLLRGEPGFRAHSHVSG